MNVYVCVCGCVAKLCNAQLLHVLVFGRTRHLCMFVFGLLLKVFGGTIYYMQAMLTGCMESYNLKQNTNRNRA